MFWNLAEQLKKKFETELKTKFRTGAEAEDYKAPKIFIGEIPTKEVTNFPCISIIITGAKEEEIGSEISATIQFAIITKEEETQIAGENDLYNLADIIIKILREDRTTPDDRFCLKLPFEIVLTKSDRDYQPAPFFFGIIETTWERRIINENLQ